MATYYFLIISNIQLPDELFLALNETLYYILVFLAFVKNLLWGGKKLTLGVPGWLGS